MDNSRTIQLIGESAFARVSSTRVLLFGVGGVGGWCAEVLVRSGIEHLTIVDFDTVAESNINRQIVAVASNIGQPKVEEMRKRLLSIHPEADIQTRFERYPCPIDWTQYDVVIDAIDDIQAKVRLYNEVTAAGISLFSSLGAGRRLDPSSIHTGEWKNVSGCPLARAMRHKMKELKLFPQGKVQCVWSDGVIVSQRGTVAYMVGMFGMQLASLVMDYIFKNLENETDICASKK